MSSQHQKSPPSTYHVLCLNKTDYDGLKEAISQDPDISLKNSIADFRIKEIKFKNGMTKTACQAFINGLNLNLYLLHEDFEFPYLDQLRFILHTDADKIEEADGWPK